MKIILIGYLGSQIIVPASKYLTSKYLKGFDIVYLNYTGAISGWSNFLSAYLSTLTDENIIFALDDYLVAAPIDINKYNSALSEMGGDVVCVKLCKSTLQEHEEYPVTTQYTIWNRNYLIELLSQPEIKNAWDFEMKGSKIFNKKCLLRTCIDYFCNSSISGRWNGVRFDGLKEDDVKYIKENLMNEKRITVFGGSGFLGHALVERLISMGHSNILAVARNEGELTKLKEQFATITTMSGDISDSWVVRKAMKDADEVYVLAAMKHVGLAELETKSCVNTNVVGIMNIVNESIVTKPKMLMFISTDKASQPSGVYGCSKKIGERLVAEAENINPDTRYFVVRYGNVFSSTGSFITKWKPKMERGEEIILTDPEATRFFWTVKDAIDLIFECINKASDATPYTPKMKAVKMGIVLEACMEVYGQCPVKIIGLQAGENKNETMDGINFSNTSEQFTKEEFKSKFLYGEDNSRTHREIENLPEDSLGKTDIRFL